MNSRHLGTHGPRTSRFRWADLDLLAVENECVRLVIWPEHGADLLEFRHKASDLDVLWKNPYVWPPRRRALDQPHGMRSEFYDVFHGGWFVSLPNGFFPADYFGAPLGCHGELQSVPWTGEILEESAERVRVRLTGRSARTPWVLTRELELAAGAPVVRWRERLDNRSAQRLPVAWLHHPAFGGPLIDGAELVSNARTLLTPPADRPELGQLRPSYRGAWPQAPEQPGGRMRDCSQVPPAGSALEHGTTRTIVELHTDDGVVGLGETYGGASTAARFRSADFVKIVERVRTRAEALDSLAISLALREKLGRPFVFLALGAEAVRFRPFMTAFGASYLLARPPVGANRLPAQPLVARARALVDLA